MYINAVVEDALSEFVIKELLNLFPEKYNLNMIYRKGGNGYIRNKIRGFNQASVYTPYIVLTDLDNYNCPSQLVTEWLNEDQNRNLIFRVAIKEVESWLIADRINFSTFLRVSADLLPRNTEEIDDPKAFIFQLVRRSRSRTLQEDILPINDSARIGPNYNDRLIEFVENTWEIQNARIENRSLDRAIEALNRFTPINQN